MLLETMGSPVLLVLIYFQRPDQNETSLAILPRGHTVLMIPHLEAEASGLLDRLLAVFQEESRYLSSQRDSPLAPANQSTN